MLRKKCEEADLAGRGGRLGTKSPFSSSPLDLLQRGPAERQFTTGAITTDSSLVEGNLGVDHYRAFCFHAIHPQHLQTDSSENIVKRKISHLVFWIGGISGLGFPPTQNLIQYWRPW